MIDKRLFSTTYIKQEFGAKEGFSKLSRLNAVAGRVELGASLISERKTATMQITKDHGWNNPS
ncbi:MAG: hypothetical protein QXL96_10755 [Ignisphaera sp.]